MLEYADGERIVMREGRRDGCGGVNESSQDVSFADLHTRAGGPGVMTLPLQGIDRLFDSASALL